MDSRERSTRTAAAVATVVALLSGCSGSSTRHASSPVPSADQRATDAASITHALRVKDELLPTLDREAHSLTTWGHYVAWVGSAQVYGPTRRVALYDLTTRRVRHVASAAAGEVVDWVRGEGEQIVYVSVHADEANDQAFWTIHTLDLTTGAHTVVARATSPASRVGEPSPTITLPWVVWDEGVGDGVVDIKAANLTSGARRTLLHSRFATDVAAIGNRVYFVGQPAVGHQDVYSLPLAGGQATKLTSSGQVARATIGSEGLAYNEPLDGDATSVWFLPRDGVQAREVFDGQGTNMAVGNGFVAWASGPLVMVRGTGKAAAEPLQVNATVSIVARLGASGPHLVYAERMADPQGKMLGQRIHLVTVTP